MYPMKRAIHLDFHTLPGIYNFNEDWDPQIFAGRLKEAGVEYVNIFAKCNLGFAYYPTKIGIPYKGMKGDMFGDALRECHRNGIGVTAYFNGGLDHEQALRHRDWLVENEDGQVIYGDRSANFFRQMCFHTGYKEYLLGMIQEVIDNYPEVDGVFIDCLGDFQECYGYECRQAAIAAGLDPQSKEDLRKIRTQSILDFCKACKQIVGSRYLRFNGVHNWAGKDLHTHAEVECLPSSWSYDFFQCHTSYARNIFDNVLYMTGRFQKNWGDFGGFKTKESLEYDIWDAYSNAVGISIGDHMHPAGNLEPAIYDVVHELYDDVKRYEPYTEGAKYVADIGVLTRPLQVFDDGTHQGISRMLGELKYGFDIVNEEMDLSGYKLLILPDNIPVTPLLAGKLRDHLAAGKGIISSGESGLNEEGTDFAMEEWKLRYDGKDPSNASYLRVCGDKVAGIADIPWSMYKEGIRFYPLEDCQVLAQYIQPYFNHGWNGFHGLFYTPPERETGHAALAKFGNIYQFCFKIFSAYYTSALKCHKQLVQHCIEDLMPNPSFKQKGLPSTARMTLTKKDNFVIAHIKATTPEPRGMMNIIEEHQYLPAGSVIRIAGSYSKAYIAPCKTPLAFTQEDGYTVVTLPEIKGYLMVVLEP